VCKARIKIYDQWLTNRRVATITGKFLETNAKYLLGSAVDKKQDKPKKF